MAPSGIDPDPALSTTEVAELFRVHPSTVKRWCDRSEMTCTRTAGGHRRIRLSEVLRRARAEEVDVGAAAFGPDAGSVWEAERAAAERGEFRPTRKLAFRWLEQRAYGRVRDLLVHMGRTDPGRLPAFLDRAFREVLTEVGRRWEAGRLGVGIEHLVSESMTDVVFRLRMTGDGPGTPERDAPVALVGCAEGELHVLGARAVRLFLETRGWRVRFLGADVPVDEWAGLQREYGARLVCVSFSSLRTRADVLRTLRALEAAYDPDLPYGVVLGGSMPAGEAEDLPPGPFVELDVHPGLAPFAEWLEGRRSA